MATKTVQTLSRSGIVPSHQALADGDDFANDGRTSIYLTNNDGSATVVSVPYKDTHDGQTVPARTCSLDAGQAKEWGPFPKSYFDATLTLTITNDTDVTGYFCSQPTS